MGNRYSVHRIAAPNEEDFRKSVPFGVDEISYARKLFGDQFNFGWAIPSLFRALANPAAPVAFPRKPNHEKDFSGALAYWSALQNLCVFRLGWAHPARGLLHALATGFDDSAYFDDLNLQILREIWLHDEVLEYYVHWGLQRPSSYISTRNTRLPYVNANSTLNERELTRLEQSVLSPEGLHMEPGGHFDFQNPNPGLPNDETMGSSNGNRNTTIVFEHAYGWHLAMQELSVNDPAILPEGTSIDAYVKTIGYMGTYKLSPTTGIWYTGAHDVHLWGNVLN